jgi:predicted alpha/beta hydrolase family esterase
MPPPVLVLPGWTNSGPDHWQSRWQRAHPAWRRVEQRDWDRPDPAAWLAALDAAVGEATAAAGRPPVLVGHSLGALLVPAWAAARPAARAAAALLVAPPDVERADTPAELLGFAPMPRARLAFPAVLAASRDDPYLAFDRAEAFAAAWGAELHDCGRAGHVTTASGHGPWPEGERLLESLLARAG